MSVDIDAREFGQHFKQGGWRLGLLVARNVKPGKAGRPPDNPSPEMDSGGKVSQTAFADKAGVAQSHVTYYYNAWQLAADEGHCQHAENLSPGDEDASLEDIDQDDEESRELWLKFYRKAREPKEPKESGSHRGNAGTKGKGSKAEKTPQAQLNRAMEQVTDDTERLSEHLSGLVPKVNPEASADFPGLAHELRETRAVLEVNCDLIDGILDFIASRERDVEDVEDVEDPPEPEADESLDRDH